MPRPFGSCEMLWRIRFGCGVAIRCAVWLGACMALLLATGLVLERGAWAASAPAPASSAGVPAKPLVRIGVLAFRPKTLAKTQWAPLAGALEAALPDLAVSVQVFTLPELEQAVVNRQLDFVLTNPAQYVLLSRRNGLQAPLATLLVDESGQELATFGGVIFARAHTREPLGLADVRGHTVAAVATDSLAGYQMQAFEFLQAGVDLAHDTPLLLTGQPQDQVVQAVLDGRADVGLVRTGVLESMAREGKLEPARLRVLGTQKHAGFPVQVSTPLYPEWPFAYLSHVDEKLARRITAALFLIAPESEAAQRMGIRGFSVPADYTPVADLLKALRVPPFEQAPLFTWRDVVQRYQWQLLGLVSALLLIFLLAVRLWLTRAALQREQRAVRLHQEALAESEFRFKFAVEASGFGLWDWDVRAGTLYLSERWKANLGLTDQPMSGSTDEWESRVHPDDLPGALAALRDCLSGQAERYRSENRLRSQDGSYRWVLELGQVVERDGAGEPLRMIGIDVDITERKHAEQQLKLAANVFHFAREGITITDAQGTIVDVNTAFTQITGYSRDEALGQNPRILRSDRQDAAFYAAMYAELNQHDHWHGEIWNRRKSGEIYPEILTISAVRDTGGALTHYVAMFFDISEIKDHERQLERIAHFDALTNLPNRVLLADRLQQAMAQAQRRNQLLAVAYLDLDGFKAINDSHGHDAGDQLLVTVAASMRRMLRDSDTLARLGGDEFVAVLTDLPDADQVAATLTRLLEAASTPVTVDGQTLQVSASLGVTFFPQHESVDADQLMRQADQAMYQAKLAGKNRYHAFDPVQDRSVRGQHERLDEIALAIARDEFVLHYQPKVNLRTGALVGVEALLRWQHPQKGLLSPGQFLPLIEGHALSIPLGNWVIAAALKQCRQWQADHGLVLQVSVNVGARQLQQHDFVQSLCDLLSACPQVLPSQLQLEVLETSALQDLQRTAQIMKACERLGVRFALDDFGTGYSSLTYLRHLPVVQVKIDQSFVRDMLVDPDDLAILEGTIGLARAFHRQVIAEGVETVEQGVRLLQLGCELAQGFCIARPMPGADIPEWLAHWQPDARWRETALTSPP